MRLKDNNTQKSFSKSLTLILLGTILLLGLGTGLYKLKSQKQKTNSTQNDNPAPVSSPTYRGPEFNIDLKKEAYGKLKRKSKEALKRGLLFTSKDDLVDAHLKIDGKAYACKLRLKGDLLDHLQGDRWSFRIVLKGNEEWNGMNTFSIHNSQSRAHTAEWVMHELFREEGIIAPPYDFLKVQLNGKDLGVYAYEQHFENQLLEKNGRSIGPILKHNDDAYWENVQANIKPFPWVEASHIELFNDANKSDPEFMSAYETGKGMLNGFLAEQLTAEEVFDLALMAKYYALLDISHAWHAQQFTNIRFYYNTLSGKLEPIAYDCFGDYLHKVTKDWEAFGEAYNDRVDKASMYQRGNVYRYLLFQDNNFYKQYLQYLEKYTNPNHLATVVKKYNTPLDDRARLIRSDKKYKDYELNWDKFYAKANFTYRKLQPLPSLSLKAYRRDASKTHIALESFHGFPLEIVGFGDENGMTDPLSTPLILESYNHKLPVRRYTLQHTDPIAFIYYKTLGLQQIHKTKLLSENVSEGLPTLMNKSSVDLTAFPFINKLGKRLMIPSGHHSIEEPLIVPSEYTLEIGAGAVLNFSRRGALLSYGVISAVGTPQNPIGFYAKGGAHGLMLSQQEEVSQFSYCSFTGLSGYSYKNITSPSGVTIYNSTAELSHCKFQNISAPEALSTQYSKVTLSHTDFKSCQGTAILSNNTALNLAQVNLSDIGRDGLVIKSGSLEGIDVKIDSVLNRALVMTDNAHTYIWNAGIEDSHHGIYAAEHARVNIRNLWLTRLHSGIEVRGQSEPLTEFEIGKLHTSDVKQKLLLKKGVTITIDGKRQAAP